MNVNSMPIFISSCDSYADIWPAFFTLFKREWPEYAGRIWLNTENLGYSYEGLDIVCTKLGKQKRFGETFLKGIDCIDEDRFLLFMIDYFIEGRVDVIRLQEIYDIFASDDADTFTLMPQLHTFEPIQAHPEYSRLNPRKDWRGMFSFQVAFWKKDSLKKVVAPWEDPWRAEWLGSRRAALYEMKFYIVSDKNSMPISYHDAGVLHGGGKWLEPAISRIDLTGIPLDLESSPRGIYVESANPQVSFIRAELTAVPQKVKSWMSMIIKRPTAIKLLVCDFVDRLSRIIKR